MSKSDAYEEDFLEMELNGADISELCTATTDNVRMHLHVDDPGEGGDVTTSPATYPGYAPIEITRPNANFAVTAGSAVSAIDFTFPQNTGADQTPTYFSISLLTSNQILRRGQINGGSGQLVPTNIAPTFAAGSLTITED